MVAMKTGTSMRMERKPGSAKRRRDYLRREEERWASRSGPVKIRKVDPATLRTEHSSVGAEPETLVAS